MLIEQIHFPVNGTNWGKIAVGAIVLITIAAFTYVAVKPAKFTQKDKK